MEPDGPRASSGDQGTDGRCWEGACQVKDRQCPRVAEIADGEQEEEEDHGRIVS